MKKNIVKNRTILKLLKAFVFLVVFGLAYQTQNKISAQTPSKIYVRFDIGHGALHCPFLGPKFEMLLKKTNGIEDFFLDKQASYVTFTLPATTEMTAVSLKKIGIDAGYPPADVVVTMDSKPIKK